MTRCKHKHNDNRGKISDARESAVTLCCVAFFIHLPPPPDVCIVYVGPKCAAQARRSLVPGPAQARAGDGAGLSLGADTRAETPTVTQGESGQRGDTETRENIINSDICGETAENTAECDSDQERITS